MKSVAKTAVWSVALAQLASCGPEKKTKKQDVLPEAPSGEVSFPPAKPSVLPVVTSGSAQVFVSTGKDAWIDPDTGVSWNLSMHVANDRVTYNEEAKEGLLGFSAALAERNSLGNLDISGFSMANYCNPAAYLFTRANFGVYDRGKEWDMGEARIYLKTAGGPVEVGRFQKPDSTMTEYSKMLLANHPVVCEEKYSGTCRLVTVLHGPVKTPLNERKQAELRLLLKDGDKETVALSARTVLGMADINDQLVGCRSVE